MSSRSELPSSRRSRLTTRLVLTREFTIIAREISLQFEPARGCTGLRQEFGNYSYILSHLKRSPNRELDCRRDRTNDTCGTGGKWDLPPWVGGIQPQQLRRN